MAFIRLPSRTISTATALLAGMGLAALPAAGVAGPNDGINALQSVTSAKANNANEEAIDKAKPATATSQPTATPPPPRPKPAPIPMTKRKAGGLPDVGDDSRAATEVPPQQ